MPLKYISTRGQAPVLGFADVLLAGLAEDGGLYVPEAWPRFKPHQWRALRGLPYHEVAYHVMRPFVNGQVPDADLHAILTQAYRTPTTATDNDPPANGTHLEPPFRHPAVAPLIELAPNRFILELFHGPTLAFKDLAMQALGRLYDHVLEQRDQHITLVGATSGDTGSAAIEAIRGRHRCSIFIMHPKGRTSEVQRRQMTTVNEPNVHNIAIEGTFDDCQNLLKAMFNHPAFRRDIGLSAVNSINWARVLPQVVYYVTASLSLGSPDRPVAFSVPTGNFGDIFAGYVARAMGLPIHRLIIASNINDILTRVMRTGEHALGSVERTLSPSMDIQISSNFERLMLDIHRGDASRVAELMSRLKREGRFTLDPEPLARAREVFAAHRVDEEQTLATIRRIHADAGYTLDPHTAVGFEAALRERARPAETHPNGLPADPLPALQPADPAEVDRAIPADVPIVTLATAHPAKFPDAVEQATGTRPALPPHLADLYERTERFDELPNDLATVQAFIRERLADTA